MTHHGPSLSAARRPSFSLAILLGLLAALPLALWPGLVAAQEGAAPSGSDAFTEAMAKGPLYAGAAAFVGGFLVSLTPCVYPMIAITVSIFGAKQAPTMLPSRTFWVFEIQTMMPVRTGPVQGDATRPMTRPSMKAPP